MRIGTWNLEGRWDARHLDLIQGMRCDILLLTEVSERVEVPGMCLHGTTLRMSARRHWAAVASILPLHPLADPHGASAMAEVAGLRVCSSVLPWRGAGASPPWTGATIAEKTCAAVLEIEARRPTVWGGDWNHASRAANGPGPSPAAPPCWLSSTDSAFGCRVPRRRIDGLLSIDHVAVPAEWETTSVERHRAACDSRRISDHDAYVVEVPEYRSVPANSGQE